MHHVFVYGTLKRGFANHHLFPPARFVGECVTVARYPLVIAGEWFLPVLINEAGTGSEVLGELYSLDRDSLAALDELEGLGAPLGYVRLEIQIVIDGTKIPAWTYTKPPDLVSLVHAGPLREYVADPRYVPGEQREQPNQGFGVSGDRP